MVKKILLFLTAIFLCVTTVIADGFRQSRSADKKISAELRDMVERKRSGDDLCDVRKLKRVGSDWTVEVLIRTHDPETLRNMGVSIRTVLGDVVAASLPLSAVEKVAGLPSVLYLETASLCKSLLDVSIPEIGVSSIWSGVLGTEYRGEDVIIGMYDYGIDWSHPDFIASDTTSRVLFLWDQTDNTGSPPEGFTYGSEYTQSDINDELDGSPLGIVQGKDDTGHGTHVAGIAAGNGRGAKGGKPSDVYVGAAPKADLIVVKGGNGGLIPNSHILAGLDYIFKKADALNRPVAVNLSFGTQQGPHDGTSIFESTMDSDFLHESEGRAIIVAAGNDGDKAIHASGYFHSENMLDTITVEFEVNDNPIETTEQLQFEVWYQAPSSSLSVTIVSPGGTCVGPVDTGQVVHWPDEGISRIYVDNAYGGKESNGDKKMYIRISDILSGQEIQNFETGIWKFLFAKGLGRFDVWLYDASVGARFTSQVDDSITLTEPGNSHEVITVGSYVSRLRWPSLVFKRGETGVPQIGDLSSFSSSGRTRDGRQKPDITAPGEFILSSLSREIDILSCPHLVSPDSMHWAMKGTSMSAPHVAGLVALMFQADPTLTASKIRDKIGFRTARKDEFTGFDVWNRYWGFGKLNALEAMRLVTSVDDQKEGLPASYLLYPNYPNPFNETTWISYVVPEAPGRTGELVSLSVYDIEGRRVTSLVQETRRSGKYTAMWSGRDEEGHAVASGIYICRLVIGENVISRKMVFLK